MKKVVNKVLSNKKFNRYCSNVVKMYVLSRQNLTL
jgi:hypothetical protein